MTTLVDRPNHALIVIDLQNGVVANAYRREDVLLAVNTRGARVPVVWVRHSDEDLETGSDAWQIVQELTPEPKDVIIEITLPRRVRSHEPRTGVGDTRRRQAYRDRRANGYVHSLDPARRDRARL
jgi:nicotinamidase-related amidase